MGTDDYTEQQLQGFLRGTKRQLANDAVVQAEWAAKKWVWIPDKDEGYLACVHVADEGESAVVELTDGQVCLF